MQNPVKTLFAELSRQEDFGAIIYLGCFLLVTITQHTLIVLIASFNQDHYTLLNYCDSVYVLVCSFLLWQLLRTRNPIPLAYWFNLAFFISHASTILLEDPANHTASLMWYAVYPVTMVATRSLPTILASVPLAVMSAAILINVLHGTSTVQEIISFTLTEPANVQILVFIVVFGLAASLMFHFLLQAFEHNHQQSLFDHLTGLFNRGRLEADLQQALSRIQKNGEPFYFLLLNLRDFKDVNDLFGHETGDQILTMLGQRLRKQSVQFNRLHPHQVSIYRLGGDQMFVLFAQHTDLEIIQSFIQQLEHKDQQFYPLHNAQIRVKSHLELLKSEPSITSVQALLNFADITLYISRQGGVIDSGQSANSQIEFWQRKFRISRELGNAITQNQLNLLYYPIYHNHSARLKGFEVLLYWNSDYGEMTSRELMLIAEATGFIKRLTEWALSQALKEMEGHLRNYPDLVLSLNISPYLFKSRRFADSVLTWLQTNQQYLKNFEFELTEQTNTIYQHSVKKLLQPLQEMGVRLALDQYGCGNSSFQHLRHSIFSSLKLDKSVIAGCLENEEVCDMVIALIEMAHSLEINVGAEFIDQAEHLQRARAIGFDFVQGDFLSVPFRADEMGQFLAEYMPPFRPLPISSGVKNG